MWPAAASPGVVGRGKRGPLAGGQPGFPGGEAVVAGKSGRAACWPLLQSSPPGGGVAQARLSGTIEGRFARVGGGDVRRRSGLMRRSRRRPFTTSRTIGAQQPPSSLPGERAASLPLASRPPVQFRGTRPLGAQGRRGASGRGGRASDKARCPRGVARTSGTGACTAGLRHHKPG